MSTPENPYGQPANTGYNQYGQPSQDGTNPYSQPPSAHTPYGHMPDANAPYGQPASAGYDQYGQNQQPVNNGYAQQQPYVSYDAHSKPLSGGGYDPNTFQQPYSAYPQQAYPYAPVGSKNKIVAGLLGIFLGGFGIHNFYLGYNGRGIAQLLLTVLSLGMLSWVSAIWALVESVLILISKPGEKWHKDASGYELRD